MQIRVFQVSSLKDTVLHPWGVCSVVEKTKSVTSSVVVDLHTRCVKVSFAVRKIVLLSALKLRTFTATETAQNTANRNTNACVTQAASDCGCES